MNKIERASFYTVPFKHAAPFLVATWWLMTAAQASDDFSQPLRVSENGHFLAQPDGKPFFWLGDAAYELAQRLGRDEVDKYLQDRSRKGFTVIFTWPTGGFEFGLDKPNRYGELPLVDKDPTRPNPHYFEYLDWIVDRAAHYGLRVALTPATGIRDVGSPGEKIFNTENAQIYGRWLAARYRHKGIIWVLGGDMAPLWVGNSHDAAANYSKTEQATAPFILVDYRPVFDAMAQGIITGDQGDPFITYHPACCSFSGTAQPRTSLYLHGRPWLDMNAIQSSHFTNAAAFIEGERILGLDFDFAWNKEFNYRPIRDEYDSSPTRPVVDLEAAWEDIAVNLDYKSHAQGYFTAPDIRHSAYQAVFAGAAGHGYGNDNVTYFYNPKYHPAVESQRVVWWEALNAPGAGQMQHLKALMLSRPYFTRIPDQSLIVGDAGEGLKHIGATRDQEGSYAMVYLPQGQAVRLDLAKIAGPKAVGWWFDPRTGAATRIQEAFSTSVPKAFTSPTSGTDQDWVLVIDDAKKRFGAPGAQR